MQSRPLARFTPCGADLPSSRRTTNSLKVLCCSVLSSSSSSSSSSPSLVAALQFEPSHRFKPAHSCTLGYYVSYLPLIRPPQTAKQSVELDSTTLYCTAKWHLPRDPSLALCAPPLLPSAPPQRAPPALSLPPKAPFASNGSEDTPRAKRKSQTSTRATPRA